MTDSDDRTEAPVSNEELYVRIERLKYTMMILMAVVLAGNAYVALAVADTAVAVPVTYALIGFALLYWGLHRAFDERGVLTRVYNLVPGIDIDETADELEDRLVSEEQAVADGGEEP